MYTSFDKTKISQSPTYRRLELGDHLYCGCHVCSKPLDAGNLISFIFQDEYIEVDNTYYLLCPEINKACKDIFASCLDQYIK